MSEKRAELGIIFLKMILKKKMSGHRNGKSNVMYYIDKKPIFVIDMKT